MNTMASSNPSGEKPCAHAILSGAAASFNTAPRQINTIDEASVPAPPTFSASAAAISLTVPSAAISTSTIVFSGALLALILMVAEGFILFDSLLSIAMPITFPQAIAEIVLMRD